MTTSIGDITMSIDGFVTGPSADLEHGLGRDAEGLHAWAIVSENPSTAVCSSDTPQPQVPSSWAGRPSTPWTLRAAGAPELWYGADQDGRTAFFVVTSTRPEHARSKSPATFTFALDGLGATVESDILGLSPAMLKAACRPSSYDVVVVVGNVMVYLAEDTEVRALRTLAGLLAPEGRMLVGFHPQQGPQGSRDYPVEDFLAHVTGAGLVVEQLFGTYDLEPPADDYVVALLRPAD